MAAQMRRGVMILLALLAGPAAALAAAADGVRLPLPALHAEPDPSGGRLVDARGREVVLRGVNVNALAEYWQYGSFPTTFPFETADAERVAGIGWNVVRLLVSWSRRAGAGVYDDEYLKTSPAWYACSPSTTSTASSISTRTPGARASPPSERNLHRAALPAFGWDGGPAWATLDGGAPRCFTLIRELNPAATAAFGAFFTNAPGPEGIGIRTRYADMLRHVARWLRQDAGRRGLRRDERAQRAGGGAGDGTRRSVRRRGRGRSRRRIYGPRRFPHIWCSSSRRSPGRTRLRDRLQRSRTTMASCSHRTSIAVGLSDGPIPHEDFERARADAALFGVAPCWSANGAPTRSVPATPATAIRQHQAYQDELLLRHASGLARVVWRPAQGRDVRDASPLRVGEFEVDCTTNDVTGPRQALVDDLTRAWVRTCTRAAGGHDIRPRQWRVHRERDGRGQDDARGLWPARLHGQPQMNVTGLERLQAPARVGRQLHRRESRRRRLDRSPSRREHRPRSVDPPPGAGYCDRDGRHPWLAATIDVMMRPLYPARRFVVPEARGDVLELGVGLGSTSASTATAFDSLAGIDPDPFMLERARQRAAELRLPIELHQSGAEAIRLFTGASTPSS
jgi:hypothetical protein